MSMISVTRAAADSRDYRRRPGHGRVAGRRSVLGDPELPSRAITSARLLWLESTDSSVESHDDDLPELPALIAFPHTLASGPVAVFPGEIYQAPRSWAERAYPRMIYFHEVDKGDHAPRGVQITALGRGRRRRRGRRNGQRLKAPTRRTS